MVHRFLMVGFLPGTFPLLQGYPPQCPFIPAILHGRVLPPDKVASLGLQVAQALARAHRNGLLHRDLKPANILVTPEGDVKVVDFGLAALLGPRDTSVLSDLSTQTAEASAWRAGEGFRNSVALVGTLPYMSPEQARGEKLDARSDIFALGVVLYEMTTGQRPYSGATSADLLREIARARLRPPRGLVTKLPLELDRIIQKALAPSRADRYQTMEDLGVDLKRLGRELESGSSPSYEDLKGPLAPWRRPLAVWGTAAAVIFGVALLAAWSVSQWLRIPADARTILILPMEVRGQTEGADYLGYAFAEALAAGLAQAEELKILPVPLLPGFDARDRLKLVRFARDQGAGRLVTGLAMRESGKLLASLSLVDVNQGRILWGEQRVVDDGDLARLSDDCVRALRERLNVRPPQVYQYFRYVTGTAAMRNWPEYPQMLGALRHRDTPTGLRLTARLIDLFPAEPDAHVMHLVALNDANDAEDSPASRQRLEEGLAALERVDPNSPYPQIQRALSKTNEMPEEAMRMLDQVLARNDLAPALRAQALRYRARAMKDNTAALANLELARQLDPANVYTYYYMSDTLMKAGRYKEAAARARQAIAFEPDSSSYKDLLAEALKKLGGH